MSAYSLREPSLGKKGKSIHYFCWTKKKKERKSGIGGRGGKKYGGRFYLTKKGKGRSGVGGGGAPKVAKKKPRFRESGVNQERKEREGRWRSLRFKRGGTVLSRLKGGGVEGRGERFPDEKKRGDLLLLSSR